MRSQLRPGWHTIQVKSESLGAVHTSVQASPSLPTTRSDMEDSIVCFSASYEDDGGAATAPGDGADAPDRSVHFEEAPDAHRPGYVLREDDVSNRTDRRDVDFEPAHTRPGTIKEPIKTERVPDAASFEPAEPVRRATPSSAISAPTESPQTASRHEATLRKQVRDIVARAASDPDAAERDILSLLLSHDVEEKNAYDAAVDKLRYTLNLLQDRFAHLDVRSKNVYYAMRRG